MRKFCILLLLAAAIFAQEFETDIEGESSEELVEILQNLEENPLDINEASIEELLLIPFIDKKIADEIIKERERTGGFTDIGSLKTILPDVIYSEIELYIRIEPAETLEEKPISPEYRVRVRMERKQPEDEGWLGSPVKLYSRVLVDYGRFTGCILTEKDAGERSITDFLAFGIGGEGLSFFDNIVIGYYGLDFGERLVLGSPELTFKGSKYSTNRKGIYLYKITGENTYKRGIACQIRSFGFSSLSLFYSTAALDADSGESIYYTYSADHTTTGWEDRKDRVTETMYGCHLDISREPATIGFTYYRASDCDESGEKIRSYTPFSANFHVRGNRFAIFGEIAYSKDIAAVCGFQTYGDRFILDVIYRYLPSSFFSPHSSPFSDRRISSYGLLNDRGIYSSILYKPFPNTEIVLYGDHMQWEDEPLPGRGNEYRITVKRRITEKHSTVLSYKFKSKEQDYARFLRFDFDIDPIKEVALRFRAEWGWENDISGGELVFGDIRVNPFRTLSLSYRYIIFDSDLSRFKFTEYESELPGVMGNRFITGHGKRHYIVLRYRPVEAIQLSLKYEDTFSKSSKFSGQADLNLR